MIDNSLLQQELFGEQLAELMSKEVYQLQFASNEKEAHIRIQKDKPSIIFVELHLPSKNGFTVGQSVMKTTGVSCVLLSGLLRCSDISWAKKLGFIACLQRPLSIVALKKVLRLCQSREDPAKHAVVDNGCTV